MLDTVKGVLDKITEQISGLGEAVDKIVLDGIKFERFGNEINEAIEKYKDTLEILSLNDCGLSNLDNFPNLTNLERLELTDNRLSGEHLKALSHFNNIQSLSLGANPIKEYGDIEAIANLPELKQLDLAGCPITAKNGYREKVYSMLKSLQILDNCDKEGKEVQYDDEDEEDEGGEEEEEGDEHGEDDEAGLQAEEEVEENEYEKPGDEVEYEDVDDGEVVRKKLKTE